MEFKVPWKKWRFSCSLGHFGFLHAQVSRPSSFLWPWNGEAISVECFQRTEAHILLLDTQIVIKWKT